MGRTQLPKPFSHACFPASVPALSQPACPCLGPRSGGRHGPRADGEGGSALPSAGHPARPGPAAMEAAASAGPVPARLCRAPSIPPCRPHSRPRKGAAGWAPWPRHGEGRLRPPALLPAPALPRGPLPESGAEAEQGRTAGSRPPSVPPSAAGGRRGAAGRGGGRAGTGGEGRGKPHIMFRGQGSLPAREPGQRPRLPRSPPLGR